MSDKLTYSSEWIQLGEIPVGTPTLLVLAELNRHVKKSVNSMDGYIKLLSDPNLFEQAANTEALVNLLQNNHDFMLQFVSMVRMYLNRELKNSDNSIDT